MPKEAQTLTESSLVATIETLVQAGVLTYESLNNGQVRTAFITNSRRSWTKQKYECHL
jgi:hypothetical protein